MNEAKEQIDKLIQELRRGTITIGVLSQLSEPQYGYSLVKVLEDNGVPVEPGTLYPLLRRLEKQGLLESQWDTNETRPRKYYLLSPNGRQVFEELIKEWDSMVNSLDRLIKHPGGDRNGGLD
ncbi:PadR family transcriptional regulator [Paenibacillus sp. CN-4]|uniref:PadR family transcriptional regulator n=1 Tax=Paenibacillus nanchangensis TaxID=3348343 RepID=UPI00397C5601